jgi:hypothetical protein
MGLHSIKKFTLNQIKPSKTSSLIYFFGLLFLVVTTHASENTKADICSNYFISIDSEQTINLLTSLIVYPEELHTTRGQQEAYFKAIALGVPSSIVIERLNSINTKDIPRYRSGTHQAYYLSVALGLHNELIKPLLFQAKNTPLNIRYNSSLEDAYYIALVLGVPADIILNRLNIHLEMIGDLYLRPGVNQAYYLSLALGLDEKASRRKLLESQYPPLSFYRTDGAIEAYYFALIMKGYSIQ